MRFVSERKQTHNSSQVILQSAPIQLPISKHNQGNFSHTTYLTVIFTSNTYTINVHLSCAHCSCAFHFGIYQKLHFLTNYRFCWCTPKLRYIGNQLFLGKDSALSSLLCLNIITDRSFLTSCCTFWTIVSRVRQKRWKWIG